MSNDNLRDYTYSNSKENHSCAKEIQSKTNSFQYDEVLAADTGWAINSNLFSRSDAQTQRQTQDPLRKYETSQQ